MMIWLVVSVGVTEVVLVGESWGIEGQCEKYPLIHHLCMLNKHAFNDLAKRI